MANAMRKYHELVTGKDFSAYLRFSTSKDAEGDKCDEADREVCSYVVTEKFCDNHECDCREVVLDLVFLTTNDQGKAYQGVAIARLRLDLDEPIPKKADWDDIELDRGRDEYALTVVESRLQRDDDDYYRLLGVHWSEVQTAKQQIFQKAQKRDRARRRKMLAERRR